ncbi:phospholipase D family protein [Sedimenticola sp.]|uniref:phospholipase D family protein n=1 Tax=Sedimenticola sp. TaxID=1940285 RepID=UPI003D1327A2
MSFRSFPVNHVVTLESGKYRPFLEQCLEAALARVWISMFLVNPRPEADERQQVSALLKRLVKLHQSGLDVRVILGISEVKAMRIGNLTAYHYLHRAGVPVRIFRGPERTGTHSKYLVLDYCSLILGSHNWTPHSLWGNRESSLFLESSHLNTALADDFLSAWQTSYEPTGETDVDTAAA